MSQCPIMVTEYLERISGTKYDVVQLLAAFYLKGIHQPIDHGSMIAVIRYNTLYNHSNTSPLILSFVLGTDVALHSVLGIPYLLAMGTVVNLVKGKLVYSELNNESLIQLDPPGKGLIDSTTFHSFSAVVPDCIPSNVPTLVCLPLQYTASDDTISPVSQATYFNKPCPRTRTIFVTPEVLNHISLLENLIFKQSIKIQLFLVAILCIIIFNKFLSN